MDASYEHVKTTVACEAGFKSWQMATDVLEGRSAPGDDFGHFWYSTMTNVMLNHWCSNFDEALAVHEERGRFLIPYRRHCVVPSMVKRGQGHFIGLSSLADEMLSPDAPSYQASKAGFSNYLEGLALAAGPKGVYVSNVRFGFVDTKMAKGDVKPLMMSVEHAAEHVLSCIDKKPVRYTAPCAVVPLVKFRRWMLRLSILGSGVKR